MKSDFCDKCQPKTLGTPASQYQLCEDGELVIGRDRNCQITLESIAHGMVSRRHATVRPLGQGNWTRWEICDLNSANGTYINGKKLSGCQTLETGDRIISCLEGPEFIFESSVTPYQNQPGLRAPQTGYFAGSEKDALTLTQLFPIASTGKQLSQKAYLYPGIATVIVVVSMFVAVGNSAAFNLLLSAYLAGAAYYFIYQLCGKHKPWWVLLGSALATVLIAISPLLIGFILVFREILPPAHRRRNNQFFAFFNQNVFRGGSNGRIAESPARFGSDAAGKFAKKSVARSYRRLGTFRRNSVRKCLGSRLYTVRNSGAVRSQHHPKCHPASRARSRTISRLAVTNSPNMGSQPDTWLTAAIWDILSV